MSLFNKKTVKIFLVLEMALECSIFFAYPYVKRNLRWNQVLILESQEMKDEDYIDRIGLGAKIQQDLKEEGEEFGREMLAKEVHEDDMIIPKKKRG